jgi:Zn-dependent protease with chaperone function
MISDPFVRTTTLLFLCLVPAAMRWWSARLLIPLRDDPVLPEYLVAHRRRNLIGLWFAIVAIFVLGGAGNLIWTLPLVLIGRVAAGYPIRRALFDERWSFVAYVTTMFRLWLAVAGFWLSLAGAPVVAASAGSLDWLVALLLGALLFFWNSRYAEAFRQLVRSQPFPDGPLLARFQAMANASRAERPRFELVDFRGGAVANALALSSLGGSSVLYTDALIRLLDSDEAVAITAHEIAHLEHYDPTRLRKIRRITTALIAGAMGAALLPRVIPELSLLLLAAFWGVAFVATLGWMARDKQRNETASDLRAVELSGDPEALIRALIKVYAFSRVPRRFDTETERAASHPSLARRIRSIRAAAGVPQHQTLQAPEIVRGSDSQIVVTFDGDRLHWQESEGATHVLSYAHLIELRVQARPSGAISLIALERGGRRWEVALDATEAARAQAILDRVDVRLAEPVARSRATPLLQIAVTGVAICAMWVGHVLLAAIALGAALRSASAFFAATGAAAVGASLLVARQAIATGDTTAAWPGLLLAVFGVGLVAGAWRTREEDRKRLVNAGLALLAVLVVMSLTAIALRGGGAVGLNQASLAIPSAAVLPLALAAALICTPGRAWRLAAIPIALVGVMVGIAGSGTFLYAFGRDPFLVTGQPLSIETLTGSPTADFILPGTVSDLRLSPGGRQIAVLKHQIAAGVVSGFSVGVAAGTFAVGTPGSQFASVSANDLLFLDDQRLLTLGVDGTGAVLRQVTLPAGAVAWEQRIQNLHLARLSYRADSNRWIVTGMSLERRLVAVEASVGSADLHRREWSIADQNGWPDAWAVDGDSVLVAQKQFDIDGLSWTILFMLDHMQTRLTRITPNGTSKIAASQLDTSCSDRALDSARLVCLAYDGTRTHLLALDPAGAPQAIGSLSGHFVSYRSTRDGWLSGWLTAGRWMNSTQLAVDVSGRRALTIPRESRVDELTVAGRVAGTLAHTGTSTRVRLYQLNNR